MDKAIQSGMAIKKMRFNKTIKSEYYSRRKNAVVNIEYGIKEAAVPTRDVLFVKVGQNGSIYGYQNKYLKMSSIRSEEYGQTTIISSNPFDGSDSLSDAVQNLEKYYPAYYLGHSNGALIAAYYAYKYADYFKELVLVNMPIKERYWPYIVGGLQRYLGDITFVYGENDPSYGTAVSMLPDVFPKAGFAIIKNADHHFTHHMETFLDLPNYFEKESL